LLPFMKQPGHHMLRIVPHPLDPRLGYQWRGQHTLNTVRFNAYRRQVLSRKEQIGQGTSFGSTGDHTATMVPVWVNDLVAGLGGSRSCGSTMSVSWRTRFCSISTTRLRMGRERSSRSRCSLPRHSSTWAASHGMPRETFPFGGNWMRLMGKCGICRAIPSSRPTKPAPTTVRRWQSTAKWRKTIQVQTRTRQHSVHGRLDRLSGGRPGFSHCLRPGFCRYA
jgi:hypothetical protein